MKSLALAAPAALALALAACGGNDAPQPLFQPQPECHGDPVNAFHGVDPQLIATLEIGKSSDGFDLDGDGMPDNKLSAVSSLAGTAIHDSLAKYDIMVPFEFFDLPTLGVADDCVKFAVYLGVWKHDKDMDGKKTAESGGDCDDTRATSAPGMPEIADNHLDDNCNGQVDEDGNGGPLSTVDNDGDGYSPAQGDCDDSLTTGPMVHPGMPEICGDGLDNDCDGIADKGPDGANSCDPFTTVQTLDVDPLSLDSSGQPLIAFTNGKIDASGKLTAGPSIFSVNIPVINGVTLDLKLTGATLVADVVRTGDTFQLQNGKLGGIIDAQTADHIRGLTVSQIGLTPDNSLLDATFANVLGTLLALPTSKQPGFMQCRTPDIDVDRDGLETFCDSNPSDDMKTVDTCIDGDGTVIHDGDDGVAQCTDAIDPKTGKPRFVDGISVELNFSTVPTQLRAPQ